MPPVWLIHIAVAGVWLYEGLWCKLLGRNKHQLAAVRAVPVVGPRVGPPFLLALGVLETLMALWVLSGVAPPACALSQTLLLVTLNASCVLWARDIIYDSRGLAIKNFAFLVLAWVSASLS